METQRNAFQKMLDLYNGLTLFMRLFAISAMDMSTYRSGFRFPSLNNPNNPILTSFSVYPELFVKAFNEGGVAALRVLE